MPKRPNAKKMASQSYSNEKAMEAATKEGKYTVCLVKKSLGNCAFLAEFQVPTGGVREIQVLVRGKFKGGRNSRVYVEPGHYVLAEGPPSAKVLEVVGIANRQQALDRLRGAGRVAEAEEEDDLFDRTGSDGEQEEDIWAKKDEERSAQAAGYVSAYIARREKGIRNRDAAVRESKGAAAAAGGGPDDGEVPAERPDFEEDDMEEGAAAAGGSARGEGPSRRDADPNSRRSRALAARLAAEEAVDGMGMDLYSAGAAEPAVDYAALAAAEAAAEAQRLKEEAEDAALRRRPVPANWEDEVDIDAI